MALCGLLKEVSTGGQIVVVSAHPVVYGQIVKEGILQQRPGVLADHAIGVAIADVQAVVSAPCTLQQQHAVPSLADAEVIAAAS